MRDQLTSFQVNEADSNYDIKQENDQLKCMLSHWVQRAKALEDQLEAKAEDASDLNKILDQNSNINQQEEDDDACQSVIQPQALPGPNTIEYQQKHEIINVTPVKERAHTVPRKVDIANFFARCAMKPRISASPKKIKTERSDSDEKMLFGMKK